MRIAKMSQNRERLMNVSAVSGIMKLSLAEAFMKNKFFAS